MVVYSWLPLHPLSPSPSPPALSNLYNVTFSSYYCLVPSITSHHTHSSPVHLFSNIPVRHSCHISAPFSPFTWNCNIPWWQPPTSFFPSNPPSFYYSLEVGFSDFCQRRHADSLLSFLLYCGDCTHCHSDDTPALIYSSDLAVGSVLLLPQYKYIHKGLEASALSDPAEALCHWNHW